MFHWGGVLNFAILQILVVAPSIFLGQAIVSETVNLWPNLLFLRVFMLLLDRESSANCNAGQTTGLTQQNHALPL